MTWNTCSLSLFTETCKVRVRSGNEQCKHRKETDKPGEGWNWKIKMSWDAGLSPIPSPRNLFSTHPGNVVPYSPTPPLPISPTPPLPHSPTLPLSHSPTTPLPHSPTPLGASHCGFKTLCNAKHSYVYLVVWEYFYESFPSLSSVNSY